MITYHAALTTDIDAVAALGVALWPHATHEELAGEFREILADPEQKLFVAMSNEETVAFVHATLRHDYVEGSTTSPVGYLEGIFVKPEFRKQGIARELVKLCETWAAEHGCTEMGSDTEATNIDSQKFHESIGFEKSETIVCFIKKIGG